MAVGIDIMHGHGPRNKMHPHKEDQATSCNSAQKDEQSPVTEELELPKILTVSEDFVQLKTHYHTILHLMPPDYEQSIGRLQNHFSDEQICTILYCSSHTTANKLMLDCLIERMSCKEDQLDFCDQLEKIVAASSNELKIIIQEIRSGVEQAQALGTHDQQLGMISNSFGVMYNMAFSNLRLNPDSKVVAVLKANYNGLCSCLPKDSLVTIKRIKQTVPAAVALVEDNLIALPPDHANAMITVLFIQRLNLETDVLSMCDIYEGIVDEGAPKKFIYTLRSELIEALSAVTEVTGYFDHLIFSHMSGFSNSKVLAILKKHCLRLCQCLPEDYMKTLDRIRRRATVPQGLVQQLASLPTPTQVNHHIVGAMLRPLTNESGVLGFCDTMESVLEDDQSKAFIESIRNEICETLSLPADAVTTNIATTTDANVTTTAAAVTTAVANTINIIQNFIPLSSTLNQLSAEQKPSEASSSSETPANTDNNDEVT